MIHSGKWRFLALCSLLAGISSCVGTKQPAQLSSFKKVDADSDGKIAHHELSKGMKQISFEQMDKNNDHVIDWDEWMSQNDSTEAKTNFAAIDKNRDKKISFPEFSNSAETSVNFNEMFSTLDKDNDGGITPDEFSTRPTFTILSIRF